MPNEPTAAWPEIFITRVIGSDEPPDVEILTLPSYQSEDALQSLEELSELVQSHKIEEFQQLDGFGINFDARACLTALHRVILDAQSREDMPTNAGPKTD